VSAINTCRWNKEEDFIQEFTGWAPYRPYDAAKTDEHLGNYIDYTKNNPFNE
jgi:hypothetical protein